MLLYAQNVKEKECIKKPGRTLFEANVRTVAAFREIGKGHEAIVNFARIINMPTLSEPNSRNINAELHTASQYAVLMSMSNAAKTALNDE